MGCCILHYASCILHPACDISALYVRKCLLRDSRPTITAIPVGFARDNNYCVVFSHFPSDFAEFYDAQLYIKQHIDLRNFNADLTNRARTYSTIHLPANSWLVHNCQTIRSNLVSSPGVSNRNKKSYIHIFRVSFCFVLGKQLIDTFSTLSLVRLSFSLLYL